MHGNEARLRAFQTDPAMLSPPLDVAIVRKRP